MLEQFLSVVLQALASSDPIPSAPTVAGADEGRVLDLASLYEPVHDASGLAITVPMEPVRVSGPLEDKPESKASAWMMGRFSFGVLTGMEFAQDQDSFSRSDLFLRFHGDTTWESSPGKFDAAATSSPHLVPDNVHTQILLTFETIPDVPPGQDFVDTQKALTLEGDFDWRLLCWDLDEGGEGALHRIDRLSLGPVIKVGVQTINDTPDANSDLDSVNHYSAFGLRIGEQRCREGEVNPQLFRYLDVTYGSVENLEGGRWMFEGILRANLTDDQTPGSWFLGFKANLGPGEDDLRIFIGTDDALGYLKNLFGTIGKAFSKGGG